MKNRQYKVTLQTPVGERYGRMTVTTDHGRIEGVLAILKEAAPFHGKICEDGNCVLNGELFTLMRTIIYEATGRIEEQYLHLVLKGQEEGLELFGTAENSDSFFSGEDDDEKIL